MKLKLELTNCYGIGSLNEELDYEGKGNTAIVYAPNGTMKTSLTKTFRQLIAGKDPCDEMYTARVSSARITIDDTPIDKNNTYVFVNNDADGSKQISTFLANAQLKGEYDAIYQQLDGAKKALKKKIKAVAKSTDCEEEILDAFKADERDNYFDCLLRIRQELEAREEVLEGYDFKFNDVFEKTGKVKDFIRENQATIQEYFEKYTELIRGSRFYSSAAKFGTSQANSLLKSVGDNRYFLAGHRFELGGGDAPQHIASKADMEAVIAAEMDRIFQDAGIRALFNSLETQLDKNLSLKGFKDVIQANPELIPELVDYDEFQRKIIRGYLKQCVAELNDVTNIYAATKDEIKDIVRRANEDRSQWEKVIDLFNARFFVPFTLVLQNKSDILLSAQAPELKFLYQDGDDAPIVQESKALIANLSEGEKRAYFILQNIFELEARRASGQETLLVFDDIADSFDYKNKYAIIEYLNDLSKDGNFKIFILTHNFDFYRTVVSRLGAWINPLADKKNDRSIKFRKGFNKSDLLKNNMLGKLQVRRCFIACIPFVRNIIEYTEGAKSDSYKKLTACLHMKDETAAIAMGEIQDIFMTVVKVARDKDAEITFKADNYVNALFAEAEDIMNDANEIDIVNKLVLSMAIRMKAEEYMVSVLTEEEIAQLRSDNRTGELLRLMKRFHANDKEKEILLMDKVLMLTSENIHINNFMFEPLVDISILHLKQLYTKVKALRP